MPVFPHDLSAVRQRWKDWHRSECVCTVTDANTFVSVSIYMSLYTFKSEFMPIPDSKQTLILQGLIYISTCSGVAL